MKALYMVSMALAFGMALPANAAKPVNNQARSTEQTTNETKISTNEQATVNDLARDGMVEVRLGQLAVTNSYSPDVKNLGLRMMHDHSQANAQLAIAARQMQAKLPATLSKEGNSKIKSMSTLHGKAFDRQYLSSFIKDHKKAVDVIQQEANRGSGEFKEWASNTLPTIKDHLRIAKDLQSQFNSTSQSSSPHQM